MKIAVVALGGNVVITPKEKGTPAQQLKHIDNTVSHLKRLVKKYRLVITHGNGPQVGDILIQQEMGKKKVPAMPLDVCGAMTQAQLGYWLQRCLKNKLNKQAVTVVTQVLVDKKDPAFKRPTKPIGPYYKKKIMRKMVKEPEGWRRVVSSPKPLKIIEIDEIKVLVKKGYVVIACGGGGIPVVKERGKLKGVEAVIDKDRSAQRLANQLKADILVLLTDVPYVYLNYGKKNQKPLKKISIKDAKKYMNHFGVGSMKPKIESSINFLKHGGKKVIITEPESLDRALIGKTGTVIQ